jgi:hypothetical protein
MNASFLSAVEKKHSRSRYEGLSMHQCLTSLSITPSQKFEPNGANPNNNSIRGILISMVLAFRQRALVSMAFELGVDGV